MIYLLDIGNTHSRLAEFTPDQQIELIEIFPSTLFIDKINNLTITYQDYLIIASVVPKLTDWLKNNYQKSHLTFISHDLLPEINFSKVNASQIGADRLANTAAAYYFKLAPAIIFDCGTAITSEIIDENYTFLGGTIMPGRQLLRQALHDYTSQLPIIPLTTTSESYPKIWGTTTEQAISCGTDAEVLGGIQHIITQTHQFIPHAKIFLTGGDADFFKQIPQTKFAPELFTLQGLAFIAKKISK